MDHPADERSTDRRPRTTRDTRPHVRRRVSRSEPQPSHALPPTSRFLQAVQHRATANRLAHSASRHRSARHRQAHHATQRTRRHSDLQFVSCRRRMPAISGVLDALGFDRAVVGGSSFGGGVAVDFAFASPERTAGLVLTAPTIFAGRGRRFPQNRVANGPDRARVDRSRNRLARPRPHAGGSPTESSTEVSLDRLARGRTAHWRLANGVASGWTCRPMDVHVSTAHGRTTA